MAHTTTTHPLTRFQFLRIPPVVTRALTFSLSLSFSLIPLLSLFRSRAISHKVASHDDSILRAIQANRPDVKRPIHLFPSIIFCIIIVHMIVWSKTNLQANKLPHNCDNWQIDSILLVVHIIILSSTSKNTVFMSSLFSCLIDCMYVCVYVNVWANVSLINHFLVYVWLKVIMNVCMCVWVSVSRNYNILLSSNYNKFIEM